MTSRWRLLLAALLACLSFSASAETFKCKLSDGTTTYQDTPCMQSGATQQQVAVTGSVLALTLSEAGMVTLRGLVRQFQGGMSKYTVSCLTEMDNTRLYSLFQKILQENINADELKAANVFYDSPTGRKFAKRDLAVFYKSLGLTPSDPTPALNPAEVNQIAEFTATPAGQTLIKGRFIDKATAMPIVRDRINELMRECGSRRY
jgi:hypothetical protein